MSSVSWGGVGYGLEFASLLGWGEAGKLHDEIFNGTFQVDIGSNVVGYYGSYNSHTFGHNCQLVFSSSVLKTLGLISDYLSSSGGNILSGINGTCSLSYGARTDMTYGGPATTIRRGVAMNKLSDKTLYSLYGVWKLYSAYQADSNSAQDIYGDEAAAEDKTTMLVVSVLSSLLYLVTAGTELAIRFAYPNYPTSSSTTSTVLAKVNTELVPRITGLIYDIEALGGWSNWLSYYEAYLTKFLKWAGSTEGKVTMWAVGPIVILMLAAIVTEIVELTT